MIGGIGSEGEKPPSGLSILDRREPMPKEIVSRMLRLPGSGISGWDTDEVANTPTLSIRQTAGAQDCEAPAR